MSFLNRCVCCVQCALPNFITSKRVHHVQQTLIAVNIVVLDIFGRNLIKKFSCTGNLRFFNGLQAQSFHRTLTPDEDDPKAMRFDALMYGIELAYLVGKKYNKARSDLYKKVAGIAGVANIPEIMVQSELIDKILHTDYVDTAGINEFEHIRKSLRDLIKYIPYKGDIYHTNFDDEILSIDWNESELENDDLKNYKAKAEFYVRQHQENAVIAKGLRTLPQVSNTPTRT